MIEAGCDQAWILFDHSCPDAVALRRPASEAKPAACQ
jgi:hypothetical protein